MSTLRERIAAARREPAPPSRRLDTDGEQSTVAPAAVDRRGGDTRPEWLRRQSFRRDLTGVTW